MDFKVKLTTSGQTLFELLIFSLLQQIKSGNRQAHVCNIECRLIPDKESHYGIVVRSIFELPTVERFLL